MEELRKDSRRKSRRVAEPLQILIFWNGDSGRHPADMCDISESGCYLNTAGVAELNELITLEIPEDVDSDVIVSLSGKVIPQMRKFVGFGVQFDTPTEDQRTFIAGLMKMGPEIKDRRG